MPNEGSQLRDEINLFFQSVGVEPFIALESNTIASIVRAVGKNLGCSFLPKNYLNFMSSAGLVFIGKTDHELWAHDLLLIKLKSSVFNKSLLEFAEVFEEKSAVEVLS